jgi:hypothetical protein
MPLKTGVQILKKTSKKRPSQTDAMTQTDFSFNNSSGKLVPPL